MIFNKETKVVKRSSVTVLVLVFLTGVIFWGGFNWSMELTNTESFCISCHEMNEFLYKEYKETIHYTNRTGVRATCPDCHVPKDWVHKLIRKIGATNELYHKLRGTIATREKFEARRYELAKTVWKGMVETDSRECRNCHSFTFMDKSSQKRGARQRHATSYDQGKTCVDCHKGIAHKLPEAFLEAEHQRFEKEKVPCTDCHTGMAQAPPGDGWDDAK